MIALVSGPLLGKLPLQHTKRTEKKEAFLELIPGFKSGSQNSSEPKGSAHIKKSHHPHLQQALRRATESFTLHHVLG